MAAPPTAGNAIFRRLAGQSEYLYKVMPWPRTESLAGGLLAGEGVEFGEEDVSVVGADPLEYCLCLL